MDMTLTPITALSSDPRDQQVKEFILATIRSFMPEGDGLGRMLYSILRRMLNQASHEDITNVLTELDKFVKGARASGILDVDQTEYVGTDDGQVGDEIPGPGIADRQDPAREIDAGEAVSDEVLLPVPASESGMETAEDTGPRHETPMAGDDVIDDSDTEAVREDGAGGHDPSDVADEYERMEASLG